METPQRYDKLNSILEVRGAKADPTLTTVRVRRCRDTLASVRDTTHRARIVRRACDELLDEAPASGGPRFQLRPHVIAEIERLTDDELPRYLFYRYRYEIFPQTGELDDFPPNLQIEPSSVCNYRCVFCFQVDRAFTTPANGHMGLMSLDLFKRVVDQAEGNCEAINIASRGEPLLCRDIEAMLAYTRGKFLALKINTNASRLTERLCHAVLQSGVRTLVFSADAAAEPLYGQLRVRGKLERVLANIEQFQRIRATQYPDVPLITRVSGVRFTKAQDIDEMEAFWGRLVDQVAFVDYFPYDDVYQRPANDVDAPCSDLWRRMYVWWDGRVNPCETDYLSTLAAGDAREQSLSTIWTGAHYRVLRQTHLARRRCDLSPCKGCTFV